MSFLSQFFQRHSDPYLALVEELANENRPRGAYFFNYRLQDSPVGLKILALPAAEQRLWVLAALNWLNPRFKWVHGRPTAVCVRRAMLELLHHKLPLEEADLACLVDWSAAQQHNLDCGLPALFKPLEEYLKTHPCSELLAQSVRALIDRLNSGYTSAETARWQGRLRALIHLEEVVFPLAAGQAWAEAALADLQALDHASARAWLGLIEQYSRASGSVPSQHWLAAAGKALQAVGAENFKQAVLRWFPLVGQAEAGPVPYPLLSPANTLVLKTLAWTCALLEDRALARALTSLALASFRKLPGTGPRSLRLGNACIWALGAMPGSDAAGQLALLKARLKFPQAQKAIDSALSAVAGRLNLAPDEVEELSLPTYGLEEVGLRRVMLGETCAELVVAGSQVELRWTLANGKHPASAPKGVKDQYPEELKELAESAKDIEKMLPAQSARLDGLYLQARRWAYPVWRERYLDHPLLGTLARRLIWKFSRGDQAASGAWWQGQLAGRDDLPLDWLDSETTVELWHPLSAAPETVMEWRAWLEQRQVRQPFKQAHRELYPLTDAERTTRVYSNRMAAHILRQHQFNALCAARGWKNRLRLMVDDEVPPATRLLPAWNLRAEFWIEGIGDDYRSDTNESGVFLYVSTDQVRFYPRQAPENRANAGGGGYYNGWQGLGAAEPLPLDQVPPLVFSEIMRDVDLFVGVASVGNDPTWTDGGHAARYNEYWERFSFGTLSAGAETRRQVLERLVPKLKIGPRCSFSERYLVVRGDLRTYKIHLGSGNILMEPNDQYLCIVPARGAAAAREEEGHIFLPFEGDQTLSIILSKAFLLAEDTKIKDPTIVRQLKR